jgi:uncharacterized RDD family membrane protein YckC
VKAISLRWLSLAYFALVLAATEIRAHKLAGAAPTWLDGNYGFEAGALPWSLAVGILGLSLLFALISSSGGKTTGPMPHLFRRWIAGWIDWILAFVVPTPFAGLAFAWIEYRRTGVFKWISQSPEPSDPQLGAIALFIFLSSVLYYAIPWWLGKATPGACIFGYRVSPDEGSRLTLVSAIMRVLLGSVALLAWPSWILSFFLKRNRSAGKFWLDAAFKTHAEYTS